ncbi:glycoside hydrolase family 32 protein [Miniimonas arenae]|uniref:beta-fructofuranosidase n=1 Tax=Miniimonas arenae TaxID=676201 RepID=A0A5C5BCA6_9MICO|nr:glycoside hydrolase family 32 protein [Miniimonas arenae]TNU73605.1 glycoside hydrolase family 32 protein [Miniimonas arenae]
MTTPDLHRPQLHARPRTGWVNDPCGVGRWDGRWHVMCQHNPGGTAWGDIEWAHLSSTDLVTWRTHPPALVPRPGTIDEDGVWTGVAHVVDGEPALVYTAVPVGGAAQARVAVARRTAADAWHQPDEVVTPRSPKGVRDVRDPYLFTWRGRRLAVQGGGTADGVALLLLFDADDLDHWRPLGTLLRGDDPVAAQYAPGAIWECPQLVPVGEDWVLLLSLWDSEAAAALGHGPQRVAWLLGGLEPTEDDGVGAGVRFVPRAGGPIDDGPAFYAPQAVLDLADVEQKRSGSATSRVLLWGWAWEADGVAPPPNLSERNWTGTLTYPRTLDVAGDRVVTALAPEVLAAHGDLHPHDGETGDRVWLAVAEASVAGAGCADAASPAPGGAVDTSGTRPAAGAPRQAGSEPPRHTVRVALAGPDGEREVWTGVGADVLVAVDHSILEAFVDGQAHTERVYPIPAERWVVTARDGDGAASGRLAVVRPEVLARTERDGEHRGAAPTDEVEQTPDARSAEAVRP